MESTSNEKADDLDISSIGALYRGQWDKKYWSSSRGKDRYPYPVGYHAIRTHAGSTYRMEIHEGLKGPTFVVSSTDGETSTGQTPDIAWENFQKKSGPRVKNWHGKRFSSKIDGVELFGFRNPFVQRLLRGLVANVNGIPDRSVVSNSCSRTSKLGDGIKIQGSHAHPNLLPYLQKQQITGKRSTKQRSSIKCPIKEPRFKRTRHQGLLNDAGGSPSKQGSELCPSAKDNTVIHIEEKHMSPSKDCAEFQVNSNPTNKSIIASAKNDESNGHALSAKDSYGNEDPGLEVKASIDFAENYNCLVPVEDIVTETEHPKCLVKKHVICPLAPKKFGADIVDMGRYSGICAPETWEAPKVDAIGSPSRIHKGDLCSMQNGLVVGGPMFTSSMSCAPSIQTSMQEESPNKRKFDTSESMNPLPEEVLYHVSCTQGDNILREVIKDSLPEAGSSSGSSNVNAEKVDLELAGQEVARSMMTFLLPRAVPLLKKTYVRKRSRHRSHETKNDPCFKSSCSISCEHNETDHLSGVKCQDRDAGKMLVQGPRTNSEEKINDTRSLLELNPLSEVNRLDPSSIGCMTSEAILRNSKDVKSVIPDSFEDEQCVRDTATKTQSLSGFVGVDTPPPDGNKDDVSFSRLSEANSEGTKKISSCPTQIDACNGEVLLPDEPEKDGDWLSDSVLADVDPDKFKGMKEELTDYCIHQIERCTDNMPLNPHVMHTGSQQLNARCINNDGEIIRHNDMMKYCPLKSESFEQDPPSINNLEDDEAPKSNTVPSHMIFSQGKGQSCSLHEQETFCDHVNTSIKKKDAKEVTTHVLEVVLNEGEDSTTKGESMLCLPCEIIPTDELHFQSHKVGATTHTPQSLKQNNVPLSEIIICRQKETITPNMHFPQNVRGMGIDQEKPTITEGDIRISTNELRHHLKRVENASDSELAMFLSQNKAMMKNDNEEMKSTNYIDPSFASFSEECVAALTEHRAPARSCIPLQEKVKDLSDDKNEHTNEILPHLDMDLVMGLTCNRDSKDLSHSQMYQKSHVDGASSETENSTKEMRGSMELLGCYLHPNPVLSILLTSMEDGLQICVVCGLVEAGIRNIFIYMVPTQNQSGGCPFFLGYTSLVLPLQKDPSTGNITSERSGLHFTPDGQSLVFSDSIKAPRCRERDIHCSCKNCKLDCSEENTIEIVHVKFGYVASVAKLTSAERVSSILVCEPRYLVAVEESGKIRVWIMNLEWSADLEEFMLPNFHAVSPARLELKRIPNSNSVIGHNGLGDFGIWDVSKRVLLAKFSSPGSTTFQILPVGLLNWHSMDNLATVSGMEGHINKITPMSNECCSKSGENRLLELSREEIGVWFLVSAVLGSEFQNHSDKPNVSSSGSWRLALLVKNKVIMGSILDPRISAVAASAGYGIYGTSDGFLCKWELSTGEKVANLHPFECGSISSIAVDAKSAALAVASDRGQLRIYVQPQG